MSAPLTNYLRTHRKRLNLSQEDVARLLGLVSGTTVTRHETTERMPELKTAIAYAVILGASVEELFAGLVVEVESFIRTNARCLATSQEDHSPDLLAVLAQLGDEPGAGDSCNLSDAHPISPRPFP